MDLSSHRFVLTWDHLVERRVRLDGRLWLPDVFAAGVYIAAVRWTRG
jgi:hypothetical protein